MCSLRVASLPLEVVTLGVRGAWARFIGGITVGPEVTLAVGGIRVSKGDGEGDGEGNVSGLEVDSEISPAEAGTDG